jgi:hypothetical protein
MGADTQTLIAATIAPATMIIATAHVLDLAPVLLAHVEFRY